MKYDSDAFNRWKAGQRLVMKLILQAIDDQGSGSAASVFPDELFQAYAHLLAGAGFDVTDPYSPDAGQAGRRSHRNLCLAYLLVLNIQDLQSLCFRRFQKAGNRTDALAALTDLASADCPEREQALNAFYEKWSDEHLVVDKWLGVPAASDLPNTFELGQFLTSLSAFALRNPSKAYALISRSPLAINITSMPEMDLAMGWSPTKSLLSIQSIPRLRRPSPADLRIGSVSIPTGSGECDPFCKDCSTTRPSPVKPGRWLPSRLAEPFTQINFDSIKCLSSQFIPPAVLLIRSTTMPVVYEIHHTTTYKYAKPVQLGEHRAMFLPRGSYRGRLLNYSVKTNIPSKTHWISDPLSNNISVIEFDQSTALMSVTCAFRALDFGIQGIEDFPLDPRAEIVPVQYTPDEWIDLSEYIRPHALDPDGSVAAWGRSFEKGQKGNTSDLLDAIMNSFHTDFHYSERAEQGTQTPDQTLASRSGTCRDYAWLMIETLRRLGFACRFISGYLYDSALDGGEVGMVGSSSTHAWVSVYLPGAGWLSYDPTNKIHEGFDLIEVAIARHPEQAVPLTGSWIGESQVYLGMDVSISVHKVATVPQPDSLA